MTAPTAMKYQRELVMCISADLWRLQTNTFYSGRRQTAARAYDYGGQAPLEELREYVGKTANYSYWYDQSIIRAYEEIIAELQRELAKYRETIANLMLARAAEAEDDSYLPSEPTRLPTEVATKIRSRTRPGLPVPDSET
jgi:hypothetical protein